MLLAGLGELLAERSGVLNLGVEGMMLMGAVTGFMVSQRIHGPAWVALVVAVFAAMAAGALMALIHAFLTITVRVNQIVSGLALTIFAGAAGLSSYLGQVWKVGGEHGLHQFRRIDVFGLKNVPVLGPLLFHDDAMVYLSWALVVVVAWYLYRTRTGLYVRSVGESPSAADAMGVNVTRYRYIHTIVGGAFAGLGGAYFTLAIAPIWTDGLTAGAGWIAIALVIFAFWRPDLLLVGRLPLRHPVQPRLHPPGTRGASAVRVLLRSTLRHDDRRARRRVDRLGQPSARHAGSTRCSLQPRRRLRGCGAGIGPGRHKPKG